MITINIILNSGAWTKTITLPKGSTWQYLLDSEQGFSTGTGGEICIVYDASLCELSPTVYADTVIVPGDYSFESSDGAEPA